MGKITQENVRELFEYQQDGDLIWKITGRRIRAGQKAGSVNGSGYKNVQINGKSYKNHRIVWLYHHGYFPENQIDHINRNRLDNRVENLREVTQTCNNRNTGNRSDNASGVKGVRFYADRNLWRVQVTVNGHQYHLGYHADFIEAACLRLAVEQSLGWPGCDSCSPAARVVRNHQEAIGCRN